MEECLAIQLIPGNVPEDQLADLPTDVYPELATLLHTYAKVLQIPTALPPQIAQDHAIPLMPVSGPVKVKPYRYPHIQKEQK